MHCLCLGREQPVIQPVFPAGSIPSGRRRVFVLPFSRQLARRLYFRSPAREQKGCTPVFPTGRRQVVLPYSRQVTRRLYFGSPGREQKGCTPVFQTGRRRVVLPYSRQVTRRLFFCSPGRKHKGCTPVFRQGAGRLYSRIPGREHATSID